MRGEYDDSVPRGLYASKPISAGDVLLSIPRALLLTAGEDGTSIPADDALILRVLAEAARADSPWAPYLRLLPPRSSFEAALPLFWDSKQIAALRCPAISARVFEQQTSLRARFEALKAMDIPAALSRPSWEDFTWAWASIESRSSCFIDDSDGQVNERQCLVPFGDSFNHHATYPSVMARFDASMDAFTFTALRGVDEGEELFVQYGPHDDATLLLTYGFVWRDPSSDEEDEEDEEEDEAEEGDEVGGGAEYDNYADAEEPNPHECCVLARGCVRRPSAADVAWLREHDLWDDDEEEEEEEASAGVMHSLTREGPSATLRATLQLVHMRADERQAGEWQQAVDQGEPISTNNESCVWRTVRTLATERLKELRCAGGDEESGADATPSASVEPAKIAKRWRANQTSLLRALLRLADTREY
jgi:hypothetical protein